MSASDMDPVTSLTLDVTVLQAVVAILLAEHFRRDPDSPLGLAYLDRALECLPDALPFPSVDEEGRRILREQVRERGARLLSAASLIAKVRAGRRDG